MWGFLEQNKYKYSKLFEDSRSIFEKKKRTILASLASIIGVILLLSLSITLARKKLHDTKVNPLESKVIDMTQNSTWRLDTSRNYYAATNWNSSENPTTRVYNWEISWVEGSPDGVLRNLTLINGQFPGPLVEANTGDRIIINLVNKGIEPCTVHFHGLFYLNQNYYDGPSRVTQCDIPVGGNLTYNFSVDEQWGTYWYHSHYKTQYGDGLFGPVIIHSPEEDKLLQQNNQTYDYDMVILVQDYYHDKCDSYMPAYLSSGNENTEPVPDNGLISGSNVFDCSNYDADSGYTCDDSLAGHTVFQFVKNKKYRIRLVNTGVFAEIDFTVDKHTLEVIELDGTNVQSYEANILPLPVGQRYSVILETNQEVADFNSSMFWVRATLNDFCFGTNNPVLDKYMKAVLVYVDDEDSIVDGGVSNDLKPTTEGFAFSGNVLCAEFNSSLLNPIVDDGIPDSDLFIRLDLAFLIKDYAIDKAYINETTYVPLEKSTLYDQYQILKNADADTLSEYNILGVQQQYLKQNNFVYTVNDTVVIDVLLNNLSEDAHPFHLHGHKFWVMKQATGNWKSEYFSSLPTKGVVLRDTVNINAYNYAVIRFVTNNPGLWLLHCSMLWHMEAGLAMQFNILPDVYKDFEYPKGWLELCEA